MPTWPAIASCCAGPKRFPRRRWAIENAKGLGCHLAQRLVSRDEVVLDVATTATSRVRELSRGGGRKNDAIDASAAASVAALQGDARSVGAEGDTTMFALLEERHANLATQRVRAVNQLHALMRSGDEMTRRGMSFRMTESGFATAQVVARIAEASGRTPSQVALNWVVTRDGVTAPIVGVRTTEELDDNLGALGWRLDSEHETLLDETSRITLGYPHDFHTWMAELAV